jgi:integrase/recombinase XerC
MTESFLHYITFEKRYSKHTVSSYAGDLNQFVSFLSRTYGITDPAEAGHAMVRAWVVSLRDNGISRRSINRKIITLRSFYGFLVRKGAAEDNPALDIRTLKTPRKLPQFIRENEMAELLDQVDFSDDFAGLRDRLVLELLYGTGIRLSELIGLRERDVHLSSGQIKVLGKRNKERVIPINKSLELLIKYYLELKNDPALPNTTDRLIVTNNGKAAYPMLVLRLVKKYLVKTSVDRKSPHVFRHTFATHLLERGADLNAVKDLLGHQSLAATQIYTHNSLGKLKKVFDQAHPKA